jgi:hypothetical protein
MCANVCARERSITELDAFNSEGLEQLAAVESETSEMVLDATEAVN